MFESESQKAERISFQSQWREASDASNQAIADCSQAVLDWGNRVITGLEPDEFMPPLPAELRMMIENATNKMDAVRKMAELGKAL